MHGDQLAFHLERPGHMRRCDFIEHERNEEALRLVDNWGLEEGCEVGGLIVGSEGSGKTHLCCAWLEKLGGGYYFSGEGFGAIAVSDVALIDRPVVIDSLRLWESEEHFLHCYNVLIERKVPLLMTSRELPSQWGIGLPDLRSRMMLLRVGVIREPDEELLKLLLERQLVERGIRISERMKGYIGRRLEHRYALIKGVSEGIDRKTLERSEGPGLMVVQEVLKSFGVKL